MQRVTAEKTFAVLDEPYAGRRSQVCGEGHLGQNQDSLLGKGCHGSLNHDLLPAGDDPLFRKECSLF